MYTLKVTPKYGRGLYATRRIYKGEMIMVCEVLALSPTDTIKVNSTDLKYYTFVYNATQDCLVLGDGEIFNHSDRCNVEYKLIKRGSRMVMAFKSVQDIPKGKQLFIDYSQDVKVNTHSYTVNL